MGHNDCSTERTLFLSFLIGGLVGAGIALLFAPQKGEKTRKQIAEMADDAKEYASSSTKKLKKRFE